MNSLERALVEKKHGMHYGTRVFLPFVVDILKAVIDDDLITDFSPVSEGAYYEKFDNHTEIYFFDREDILSDVSKYETIKMVVVDDQEDMFNFDNHIKISLDPKENHKLVISKIKDDVIFID